MLAVRLDKFNFGEMITHVVYLICPVQVPILNLYWVRGKRRSVCRHGQLEDRSSGLIALRGYLLDVLFGQYGMTQLMSRY
jgi:hypothetical protein